MLSVELEGLRWLTQLRATFLVPTAVARRATNSAEGNVYGYFLARSSLATLVGPPWADQAAGLPTHSPVALPPMTAHAKIRLRVPMEPTALPKSPSIGCSRHPISWTTASQAIYGAHDDDTLQLAWDMVVTGVESELLHLYDKVGGRGQILPRARRTSSLQVCGGRVAATA